MRILSFDTSTSNLHVALLEGGDLVASRVVLPTTGNRADVAAVLIPTVAEILTEAGWHKRELQAIVVGQGPGSFTGIRVAVITARTLAQNLSLPLVGVSYLDVLAAQSDLPVAVVISASVLKPVFYVAGYERSTDDPVLAVAAPRFASVEEARAHLLSFGRWLVDPQAQGVFAGGSAALEPLPDIKNIAAAQAQLAYNRLSLKAAWDSPWQDVYPLYLQNPSVTAKQDHGHRDQKSQTGRP